MIISNQIKNTKHFKSLDPVIQKITLKKAVREQIRQGVVISKNKSFNYWVNTLNPRYNVMKIVEEIHNENTI